MTTALTCEQVTSHLPDGRPQALKTDLAVPGLSTVQFPSQGPNPGPQHWELEVPGAAGGSRFLFKNEIRNSLRVPFRNMSRLGTGRAVGMLAVSSVGGWGGESFLVGVFYSLCGNRGHLKLCA